MRAIYKTVNAPQGRSWRDVLPIHPAAELFPRMSPDELKALSADIAKNGQRVPIAIIERARSRPDGTFHVSDPPLQEVLDGRSRLDAMESAGINVIGKDGQLDDRIQRIEVDTDEIDPVAFVVSCNIHRRHLTAEQKREIVAALLKARAARSNREIAETTKTDHKTVGLRTEMEGRGEIPHVAERADTKGRKQPARKTRTATTRQQGASGKNPPAPTPGQVIEDKPSPRDDIGASGGEKRRLEIVEGLRSEVEEAKAAASTAACKSLAEKLDPLIETLFHQGLASAAAASPVAVMIAVIKLDRLLVEHGIMPKSRRYEDPQAYARAVNAKTARQWKKEHPPKTDNDAAPPPTDDGLDIPECLRRSPAS